MNRPVPRLVPALAAAAAAVLALSACTPASSAAASYHACLDDTSLQFTSIATSPGELDCGQGSIPVSWLAAGADGEVPSVAVSASPAASASASASA
ncbi:MAG: hypothetical protein ACI38L_00770, partial [Arthrobacter koreensis]